MKTVFAPIGNAFGVASKVYRAPTCSKIDETRLQGPPEKDQKKVYRAPSQQKFTGAHHKKFTWACFPEESEALGH